MGKVLPLLAKTGADLGVLWMLNEASTPPKFYYEQLQGIASF